MDGLGVGPETVRNSGPVDTGASDTYRWSCLLNAFEHIPQTYFRSSLCVSLCLARADAFPNTLLQT